MADYRIYHGGITVGPDGNISIDGVDAFREAAAERDIYGIYDLAASYGANYGLIGTGYHGNPQSLPGMMSDWFTTAFTLGEFSPGNPVYDSVKTDLALEYAHFVANNGRMPSTADVFFMHEIVFAQNGIPGAWIGTGLPYLTKVGMAVLYGMEPWDFWQYSDLRTMDEIEGWGVRPAKNMPEGTGLPEFTPRLPDWFTNLFDNPPISPLVFDLTGDGLDLIDIADSHAFFDLNLDGFAQHTAWIGEGNAFLAYDWNGNGVIDDNSELFGSATVDGFTILAQYDTNGDGVIDAQDEIFDDLLLWQDLKGNGNFEQGQPRDLVAASVHHLHKGSRTVLAVERVVEDWAVPFVFIFGSKFAELELKSANSNVIVHSIFSGIKK